jgi:outer membrane lipoprotein-sorting protein
MRKYFIFLLGMVFTSLLFGQVAFKPMKDTALFRQKVEKMSQETNSLESDFTQVKNLAVLSEKIISKGHFWFLKQNNLRWEYHDPYKYVIVVNKEKILIKDEANKVKKYDMNSNKVFKEINDIMITCVNGNIFSSGKFKISYFENEKGFKLELYPLNRSLRESLEKINMFFDKSVTSVVRLEMIENGADTTTIDFTNKKINAPVAPEKFNLK